MLFSHWNFRVIKEGKFYHIRACYYDKTKKAVSWADRPPSLESDEKEDLETELRLMLAALEKPVIEVRTKHKLMELKDD